MLQPGDIHCPCVHFLFRTLTAKQARPIHCGVFKEKTNLIRCLNWLVGQHLSSQRCWLTTSLMARFFLVLENNRSAFLLPVRLSSQTLVHQRQQWREWWESVGSNTAQKSSPGSRQYNCLTMILFNREKLLQLLKVLNLPDEAIESVSQAYFSSPQVSLLSLLLKTISNFEPANPTTNSIGKMKSADTVPLSDLEDGVGAKLLRIEGKYEKILQQVFLFRNSPDTKFLQYCTHGSMFVAGRRETERCGEITAQGNITRKRRWRP